MAELLPTIDAAAVDFEHLFSVERAEIWLEIGFGGGEHLAAQALAHPDIGFIGCEPFINGVATLLAAIEADGMENIRILHDDARPYLDTLPDHSIDRVFLLFSDPWPKKKHHRRRFVNQDNLARLARVMKPGADLRFATDDMDFARWTLERLPRHRDFIWIVDGPGDWRERPGDAVVTRYETKALSAGKSCVYLTFRRKAF